MGTPLALRLHLEGAEAVSSHVVDPLLLASTSLQRRTILEQLGIPYDVVAPTYVEHDSTRVTFRELAPRELARHMAHGEWEGRAGGYAIQGRGGALVEEIDGDYLNVVGLPAALLVRILAERFPGTYGFG